MIDKEARINIVTGIKKSVGRLRKKPGSKKTQQIFEPQIFEPKVFKFKSLLGKEVKINKDKSMKKVHPFAVKAMGAGLLATTPLAAYGGIQARKNIIESRNRRKAVKAYEQQLKQQEY